MRIAHDSGALDAEIDESAQLEKFELGVVTLYKGKPEIEINDKDQIVQ